MLTAMHEKVEYLNNHFLPPGVKIVPFLDRSDLVHFTTHTVMHNLAEGILLVSIILVPVPGEFTFGLHCGADDSVRAAVCFDLPGFE